MKFFFLILISILSFNHNKLYAYSFNYNERCSDAYKEYLSLRLDEGTELVKQELSSNPGNLSAVYLSDYHDFFILLFNGDRNEYEERKANLDKRISLIEKGSKSSPWYKISKAGIYMHWAMVFLRIGENYKAATHFRKAYLLAK